MSPSKNDIVSQVKSLIKKAELEEAINVLVDFLKDDNPVRYQEAMILSFRLNDYNKN